MFTLTPQARAVAAIGAVLHDTSLALFGVVGAG
jgi:hypothetical protein